MDRTPVTIVTGASSGIGTALAQTIAADGRDLLLVARRGDRLDALAQRLPTKAHTLVLDLAEPGAGEALTAFLEREGLVADVLVNNAGMGHSDEFADAPSEAILRMVDLNVRALVDLTHRLLPAMLSRGRGGVLNVASTAAFLPGPRLAVYYASKAFVLSFSEALWEECRRSGVTVSALCPGPTVTEFGAIAKMDNSRLFRFGRKMSADDVARIGWKGFRAGRRVVVTGLSNRVTAAVSGLTPHAVLLPVVRYLQSDVAKG